MAQRWEVERTPGFIPHPDLRKKSVVKRLIDEGRPPFIVFRGMETQMDVAVCSIPAGNSKPAEIFELSIEDARRIALIRNELQRLT